jgi:hypothetical protein
VFTVTATEGGAGVGDGAADGDGVGVALRDPVGVGVADGAVPDPPQAESQSAAQTIPVAKRVGISRDGKPSEAS